MHYRMKGGTKNKVLGRTKFLFHHSMKDLHPSGEYLSMPLLICKIIFVIFRSTSLDASNIYKELEFDIFQPNWEYSDIKELTKQDEAILKHEVCSFVYNFKI